VESCLSFNQAVAGEKLRLIFSSSLVQFYTAVSRIQITFRIFVAKVVNT
jgi:hypothetical protein